MAPYKKCPQCNTKLHIRLQSCGCGYTFVMKRSKPVSPQKLSKKTEMRFIRENEREVVSELRKESDKCRKAKQRALESDCKKEIRREKDRIFTAKKRALESDGKKEMRREKNRICTAKKRALESDGEIEMRREEDRIRTAKRRAIETPEKQDKHREQEKIQKAQMRALVKSGAMTISIQVAVSSFLSKVSIGPEFVCTICHRMMYKQNVVLFNVDKYTKATSDVLDTVCDAKYMYISPDGKHWVCKTCHGTLSRGNIPVQAKTNGLGLCVIPPELSCLNALELRLIALRVPFMKMVALPVGKQRCIHGPAVNVPSKLDSLCTILPRLPSQSELIPLKFKRKLSYKGHYMYDFITPDKLTNALRWLKANNPLYANVDINNDWIEQALANDEDLCNGFIKRPVNDTEYSCDDDLLVCSSDIERPSSQTKSSCSNNEMCTEELNVSSFGNSNIATNEGFVNKFDNVMECEPSSYPGGNDALKFAYNTLATSARVNNFVIHDVPADGDCLFSAIAYQLDSIGIHSVDKCKLRQMVATYLDKHSSFYQDFVVHPVASNNAYNADTEAPTPLDAYIESIVDPDFQTQLRWKRYLQRLRDGAWGDHIVITGISNMLNITINVLHSQDSSVDSISPMSGSSQGDVNLGFIMQYHYVGLDRINTPNEASLVEIGFTSNETHNVGNIPEGSNSDNTDSPLDDATIEEGDEHTRQITGGPQSSMMSIENPETFGEVISIAPAEGQRPLSIMTDTNFEAMCNPDKFCYGTGTFSTERHHKLTYRKYFNQRLLDVDGRFARDLDYLFVAQYIVESKQVFDDANNFIWRQKPSRQLTASQAKNAEMLSQFVCKDKAYRFMKNVRGSPPYHQRTFYELLAMIRQLGTPTWFFTLSAADMKWADMIQCIARQYGVNYTDEQVAALSFDEKSRWLRCNPVTAARHFQYRLNTFFQLFLNSSAKPLGEIVDYGIRIEFQARGSPHAHCVIWVKDAPKYGVSQKKEVCDFISQYISCAIPEEDGKLKELVLLLQQHKHSSYCKRNYSCRFNFPHPPSTRTLIAEPDKDNDVVSEAQDVLAKVRKALVDGHTELSLEELLIKAKVGYDKYMKALEISSKGSVVLLKRKPKECFINNYNASVMLAWQANIDLQFVLNAYACVMYIASYIMKTDRAMGELLRRVVSEARTEDLKTQLKRVGSAFLTHREVSAQEAVYRILSLPMKQLSRAVVFVDTNPKNERIAVLKDSKSLNKLDDDDTNVFQKSLIDRYQHRPQTLQSMCLAEFAATFVTNYEYNSDNENDVLPPVDNEISSSQITLTDGFGKMNRRKREAVIRFRQYNKDAEPSNWYRAKLMLYYPWYNEQTDLLGGYSTYEEHYNHVNHIVHTNESKYTQNDIDNLHISEDGPPEHLWCQIAPSTEESRSQSLAEGSELLTEMYQEDLQDNENLMNSSASGGLSVRFESAANSQEIPAVEYRQLLRSLNVKQKNIVMFHRKWCKNAIIALKDGRSIQPYRVFLSGPGGVGKSHVIRLIHSDTLKLLRLSGTLEPDDVTVLLTAPTGVAAFNINGMTLHSAFLLGRNKHNGFQPLNHDCLNTLRSKLCRLALVIIDEISMVGANMLLEIHKRLQQIKGVSSDITFGGVSILAVGDLYQLPPIGQSQLFSKVSDSYAQLYRSGSMWVDEFEMIELTEIMRQRGDSAFCELLCRVRTADCTSNDIDVLKSQELTTDMPDYPHHALHVYRLNVDVDKHNTIMLNSLASEGQQYSICASDSVKGQTSHIDLSSLSDKRSETGGLHGNLKLAIGARVMLTTNVDVSDGLVNGACGEVVHIVANSNNKVTTILVKFDNSRVGLKAIQSSQYCTVYTNAVPLYKQEVIFFAKGRRGSEITRCQFPLTLAWSTTIHKVQGLTLDEIVVDMKGGHFSPGQAYVAFSRVRSLQGLHILNFNPKAIKKSVDVENEMVRLNTKLLPLMSTLQCLSLSDTHINIALLNIRSVIAKVPDVQQDSNLIKAIVVCFCETWLTPSQPSPILFDNHLVIRCDNANGEKQGGVMMSVDNHIQLHNVHKLTSAGIESLAATMSFLSTKFQIALVYRSPSVSVQQCIAFTTILLNQLSASDIPTIVLGDFNDDILNKPDSTFLSFMSNHGYTQLVLSATTDRGTLIDHIYFNRASDNVTVEVSDTYYSDHDTVYCSIPF